MATPGNYGDAIASYRQCIVLDPSSARYHYNVAVALQHHGDYSSARRYYTRSIELDPSGDHSDALFNLGGVLQSMGNLSEAGRIYVQLLKVDPLHVEARLNYCNVLFASLHLEATERCYLDVLRVDSSYPRGLVNLAAYYASLDDPAAELEAIALYKRALAVEPTNAMALHGLRSLLLLSGDDDASRQGGGMDSEYVSQLFDSYSFHFEQSLLLLQYQSHLSVANATVDSIQWRFFGESISGIASCSARQRLNIIDVGAGTGLVCIPLREGLMRLDWAAVGMPSINIVAVDLSEKMLAKAKEKNCYNSSVVGDIGEYLAADIDTADAIVAADVFMYFGDLSSVLQSCFHALSVHGYLVFTVEDLSQQLLQQGGGEGEDGSHMKKKGYHLQKSGRFAHSSSYIEQCVHAISSPDAGFKVDSIRPIVPRYDKGQPVHGLLIVAQKHSTSAGV
jgi:predicted TPR repeat methyltransferase